MVDRLPEKGSLTLDQRLYLSRFDFETAEANETLYYNRPEQSPDSGSRKLFRFPWPSRHQLFHRLFQDLEERDDHDLGAANQ